VCRLSQTREPPCFTSNAGDCCPYIAIYATDKIDTFLSFTIKAAVLRVGNLDNADQRIADDLHQFCYTLSDLFARTFKPLLDVVLSTHRMGENMGYRGLLILYAYFLTSGLVIKRISPPFAEYIAKTQRLEGDFRRAHSRLITHAEEVAFLDGARREEQILNSRLQKVTSWTRFYHYLQWKQGVVDQWLVKYLASMIGWPVLAFPFLADKTNRPIAELAALYRESDTLIQRLVFPNHHIPRLMAHTRLTLSC
jgi:ATP-binding cassette subfamily D (ALD) protein 3